jgi:hypothetical protein
MNSDNSGCGLRFSGVGFSSLLAIAFIVLKLTDVISWSWIWVLAPMWLSLSISVVFLIISAIIKLILYCLKR